MQSVILGTHTHAGGGGGSRTDKNRARRAVKNKRLRGCQAVREGLREHPGMITWRPAERRPAPNNEFVLFGLTRCPEACAL